MKLLAILAVSAAVAMAADTIQVSGRQYSVPVASDWVVAQEDGAQVLRMAKNRGPLPDGPRRPIQFALTEVPAYGQATVEVDAKPLSRSLILVFGYRDEAHFNYAHLSVDTAVQQPVHNGVFHVYGGERVRISADRGAASFAASGRWYHVKLTHNALTGAVSVAVDGRPVPSLHAVDVSLGAGKIGFGSFDETAVYKNVKISTTPAK